MKTRSTLTACLAMLAIASTSFGTAYAACEPTKGDFADPSFTPDTLKIDLSGNVNDYMEAELIQALESNLTQFPALKTIKIDLYSTGGNIYVGFRIHNYLKGLHQQNGLQIIMHNTSYVESAAVSIYCGGNQRIVSPYSSFMVHEYSSSIDSRMTVSDMENKVEDLGISQEAGEKLVSACTSLTSEQAAEFMLERTYLDPDQALDIGLAHSIIPASYDRQVDIHCEINGDNAPE